MELVGGGRGVRVWCEGRLGPSSLRRRAAVDVVVAVADVIVVVAGFDEPRPALYAEMVVVSPLISEEEGGGDSDIARR